jgi:hypothetical protein
LTERQIKPFSNIDARSSTTAFTPNAVLPTSTTDENDFIDFHDDNDNDVEANDVDTNDVPPTAQFIPEVSSSTADDTPTSSNTPLFLFLASSTTTSPDVSTEPTLSNSVQVEFP